MMEHIYDYVLFLAQVATLVIGVVIVIMAAAGRQPGPTEGHLTVEKLNDQLDAMRDQFEVAMLSPDEVKKRRKAKAKRAKADRKGARKAVDAPDRRRVFLLEFDGDIAVTKLDQLTHSITATLTSARQTDEVVVRVESPGGIVHGYGLAASQLLRIRKHGIPLTVAVDKVAASGGYLMASVADRILAAPFAVIGSIGVVAQIPNVHRLLKKHDVDVEVLTAGKYKRTLTVLGENTDEDRAKFVEDLEETHELFQEFVAEHRPALDLDRVATGEVWYGKRALAESLVDELITSDEYLVRACEDADVYRVQWRQPKKPLERVLERFGSALKRAAGGVLGGHVDGVTAARPMLDMLGNGRVR